MDANNLDDLQRCLYNRILDEQDDDGMWRGQLSSSALATATALVAFEMAQNANDRDSIAAGIAWLKNDQNPDGGWGDSPESPSNLSTSLLCQSALHLLEGPSPAASRYIEQRCRALGHTEVLPALLSVYGKDRTFAVPILMQCAFAGLVSWRDIPALPFELSCLPRWFFSLLRLQVVSYALPALIAIGRLLHKEAPSRFPPLRWLRNLLWSRSAAKLEPMQPASGGYLEAIPLTAFVVMSLLRSGEAGPVSGKGLSFLRKTQRPDGSWPIDTDLSMWLTTSCARAFQAADCPVSQATREKIHRGSLQETHPFTGAAPGGWAWTDRSGGVPDGDDTAGALLALHSLGVPQQDQTVEKGLQWLLDLQNRDGGWPTFCRGWTRLPFDSSCADITAHALQALLSYPSQRHQTALRSGFTFLSHTQRKDGAWLPLWFGSQLCPGKENPIFGTARVLPAYTVQDWTDAPEAARGLHFLLTAQNPDGGWGPAPGVPSSTEETALCLTGLAGFPNARAALDKGAEWLMNHWQSPEAGRPSPIGLYFASLWYSERLYPLIWSFHATALLQQHQKETTP